MHFAACCLKSCICPSLKTRPHVGHSRLGSRGASCPASAAPPTRVFTSSATDPISRSSPTSSRLSSRLVKLVTLVLTVFTPAPSSVKRAWLDLEVGVAVSWSGRFEGGAWLGVVLEPGMEVWPPGPNLVPPLLRGAPIDVGYCPCFNKPRPLPGSCRRLLRLKEAGPPLEWVGPGRGARKEVGGESFSTISARPLRSMSSCAWACPYTSA